MVIKMHEGMNKIIANMEAMASSALTESVPGVVRPMGVMGREDPVMPDMDLPLEPMDQPGQGEVGINSNGTVSEAISTGAIDRLVDAMAMDPKVRSMLSRFGVLEPDIEQLKVNLLPAVQAFFLGQGSKVAGASKAKANLRTMAKF